MRTHSSVDVQYACVDTLDDFPYDLEIDESICDRYFNLKQRYAEEIANSLCDLISTTSNEALVGRAARALGHISRISGANLRVENALPSILDRYPSYKGSKRRNRYRVIDLFSPLKGTKELKSGFLWMWGDLDPYEESIVALQFCKNVSVRDRLREELRKVSSAYPAPKSPKIVETEREIIMYEPRSHPEREAHLKLIRGTLESVEKSIKTGGFIP